MSFERETTHQLPPRPFRIEAADVGRVESPPQYPRRTRRFVAVLAVVGLALSVEAAMLLLLWALATSSFR